MRLLSEIAATISTLLRPETAILVAEICFCSSESEMRRIFIMCCFDVRLLRLLCAEFVVGGLLTGSHGLLFRTGMRGSLTSGFFRRLSAYWKAFFVSLSGPYGSCGTALYLMLLLLPARRSLMI
nr:hypothetical protein [Tanacetum cinerariifolium]